MLHKIRERAFEHLLAVMRSPEKATALQIAYNKERYENFVAAFRQRPAFLPVTIVLPPDEQSQPIKGSTDENRKYDVIITGAITDGENKRINFFREIDDRRPLIKSGIESPARLSLDAIAGKSRESSGITGIQPFVPFVLPKGEQLSVEIFKDEDTPNQEIVNIVFTGYRVFAEGENDAPFTDRVKAVVMASINESITPEYRWMPLKVTFDEAGAAIVPTQQTEEPLLIWGFRSTVANCKVNIGYSDERKFTRDYFPIWALANESGNYTELYNQLYVPIPLIPQEELYLSFLNTINNLTFAGNGQFELLCQKP